MKRPLTYQEWLQRRKEIEKSTAILNKQQSKELNKTLDEEEV